jgi:alkylation response protein AidB-like acyl-CoA dehydrogenase
MSGVTRETVQQEVRDWLQDNWDPQLSLQAWRERLVDAGWAVPSWSRKWFGRDLPAWADQVVAEELRLIGAVGNPLGSGMSLAAPTIVEHGSDELKRLILRQTLTGEKTWCQLFSEPGAGSDLASLSASAVLDGDEWVINGQKVWNTSAHHADYGMLLARTNRNGSKHQGITYFILPMRQPGVEVRPIKQMNYHSSFNEVFMTDARIPANMILGTLDDGWRVQNAATESRAVGEAEHEAEEHFKTYVWYPQRAGRVDLVVERAQALGVSNDPVIRQNIAELLSFQKMNEWTALRARAARALGRPPGPEGSIGKLAASEVSRMANRVHTLISGAHGMLQNGDHSHDATIAEVLVSTPAQSIAGGTDQIQRSIIGEKILGLPRDASN